MTQFYIKNFIFFNVYIYVIFYLGDSMVKYLVESQMGGYYVTDVNPLDVHRSSDTYDGLDTIITYWDDIDQDYMMKQLKIALMRRFNSDSNFLRDIVENNYEVRDASLTEVVEDIIWFS